MRQSVKQTKALAQAVKDSLPERLLKGDKRHTINSVSRRKTNDRAELDRIEASYNQLREHAEAVGAGQRRSL